MSALKNSNKSEDYKVATPIIVTVYDWLHCSLFTFPQFYLFLL